MGIFGKLFGSNSGNSNQSKKTEIADFFQIDLKSLITKIYRNTKMRNLICYLGEDGTIIQNIKIQLQYKEMMKMLN